MVEAHIIIWKLGNVDFHIIEGELAWNDTVIPEPTSAEQDQFKIEYAAYQILNSIENKAIGYMKLTESKWTSAECRSKNQDKIDWKTYHALLVIIFDDPATAKGENWPAAPHPVTWDPDGIEI